MRYHYFYQSKENKSLEGWITARDRNDAYTLLRKQGIKPYKLLGKNPLAWKQWTAIVVLAAMVTVLAIVLATEKQDKDEAIEPRAQLYGDPSVIQKLSTHGWREIFGAGDAWFARHAIPAAECDCKTDDTVVNLDTIELPIKQEDAVELAKMKRMVNWMKREFADFVAVGGTEEDYKSLCDERLATERGIVNSYNFEFDLLEKRKGDISAGWEKRNATLRSMGLPTLPLPEGED